MGEKGYNTNLAAEFYVLSSLHRMGLNATLTLGNKKAVDIVVIVNKDHVITVDVKGLACKRDWIFGNGPLHVAANHIIALVGYEGMIDQIDKEPRTWIVPSLKLKPFIKTAGNGKTKYVPRKRFLEEGKQYENAWDVLKGMT